MERKNFYDGLERDFLPESIEKLLTYNYDIDRLYFKKDTYSCRDLFSQLTMFIRTEIDAYYHPPIIHVRERDCVNICASGFLFLSVFLYQRIRIASPRTSPQMRMELTPYDDVLMFFVTPMATWNRVIGKDVFLPKAIYLAKVCNIILIAEQEGDNMVIRMAMPHYTSESFKLYQPSAKFPWAWWMKKAMYEAENQDGLWSIEQP